MRLRVLALAAFAVSYVAFAQSPTPDVFQVAHASNLNVGDSVINFTNAGVVNGLEPAGNICVNVYAFDPAEELISCCACQVTPNSLNSFSAQRDLLSFGDPTPIAGAVGGARRTRPANTIALDVPTSIVVELVATLPSLNNGGSYCDAGNGGNPFPATGDGALAPGLRAWLATPEATPSGSYRMAEIAFENAVLSPSENFKLTSYCNFIEADGSFGICHECQAGNITAGADLTIGKSHTGNFAPGDIGDSYTITVQNVGSGPTDGSIVTVSDSLPAGLTPTGPTGLAGGWSCGIAGQTVTCMRSDLLAANSSYRPIPVTVNVAQNAASSVTNTATVSGGGDTNLANNSASDQTNILQFATITVASDLSGPAVAVDNGTPFTGSQTFTWLAGSSHTIAASTPQSGSAGVQYAWLNWSDAGAISHSVTTPSTATTYTANFQTQYLLTTAVSPSGEGTISPATEYVNTSDSVSVSASANSTYVFTGFSGGLTGTTNPQNVNMTGPMTVTANFETGPDPAIAEMYNGNFRQGDTGDTYTITVTNLGQAATSGALQWVDTLPAGLTATGLSGPSGWTCTVGTLTCSTSNSLAGGANAVFTLTMNVAANAAPSIANTVTVSGGGDVHLNNDTASLATPIIQVADLTITKTHSGSFVEGQSGTYTITASNAGAGPTAGTVTVTDTLPSGLAALSMSGTGWTCKTSTLTCTSSSVLASNASYPAITLTVLAGNAQPSVTNTARVSGGGELNTSNDTATDPTTIIRTVQVTVTTSPANLLVTVDGSSVKGPHTFTWNVGATHTIAAPTPQGSLKFQKWSDGGAVSHTITVSPATATYTATFH